MRGKNTKNGRTAGAVRRALTALVLGLLVHSAAAAAERQGPRIYVHEGRFDLGAVEQGAVPEHIFEIRNLGDEVLEIGRVQPTWGCTAGLVSSDRLEPGATAQLKVAVDTAGRSGFMAKHVAIHSNDRVQPTTSVTVLLTVREKGAAQK